MISSTQPAAYGDEASRPGIRPPAPPSFFFSSRRRHTSYIGDWSSDVCSSDLAILVIADYARIAAAVAVVEPLHDEVRPVAAVFHEMVAREAAEHAQLVCKIHVHEIGRASCRERG